MSCGDSGPSCPAHDPHLSPGAVRKIQEIILWRNPVAVALTFTFVEFIFFFIATTNLGFFPTILFLHILHNVFRFISRLAGTVLDVLLFRANYNDLPDQPNRIRTFDEVNTLIHKCHEHGRDALQWLSEYRTNPTLEKHFFFFSTLFFFFVIATALGTFWLVFLIVHAVLIIPGAVFNPRIRDFAEKKIRTFREAAQNAIDEAKAKQQ
jgi:hypothetical protein